MKEFSFIVSLLLTAVSTAQISMDTNYAGANVIIDSVAVDTVYFRPDLRTTQGKWFYWNFRAVSNVAKKWYFKANDDNILTSLGASFSTDGGNSWQWINQDDNLGPNLFSYTFEGDDATVRLSIGQPYTEKNFKRYIESYKNDDRLKLSVLTTTRKGREVERMTISDFSIEPRYKILITSRHHACEMMSNYMVEGIVGSLLSDDPKMVSLLKNAEITIIPFVDKDGVEEGDQGKNRWPRDHNRDYSGTSIYESTSAIRELKEDWIKDDTWIAIDLHNPWILGKGAERIYFVGKEPPAFEKQQKKLAQILSNSYQGELSFNSENNFLAWGESWNTNSNNTKGWSFGTWSKSFFKKGLILGTTVEFPYALNGDQVVTAQNAREFGRDLIYALKLYIDQQ
ncbi:MAG TPA: peptidase M14 [Pricia antarctica]|uniref:Peptidase M14 n=2 Tax=root TaxID=1 RepID=A0A831QPW3_9FLAO|nr:peptidase M14 [Pricia antarctica]